ncbi:hypothetical protein D0Z03_001220 [Geotrichum reessii]|nr:hypothetical protein D0Z03_001220 [Galactomyces reessii]
MSTVSKELRRLAILADNNTASNSSRSQYSAQETDNEENNLERASRAINRSFTICLNDRSLAKRRAVYFFFGELCKVYFHLHQKRNLIKYNLRVLATNVPAPSTAAAGDGDARVANFPKAHIATFHFYSGVVAFIDREYTKAQASLESALQLCQSYPAATPVPSFVSSNLQLVLLYLIPLRLLLLAPAGSPNNNDDNAKLPLVVPNKVRFPALHALYAPLLHALRAGDLHAYRAHAHGAVRRVVVRRHLAAAVDRLELLVVYALLRRVHAELAQTGDPSRIDIGTLTQALALSTASPETRQRRHAGELTTALNSSSSDDDDDEIEDGDTIAYLVQLISMGLVKGYVSPDNGVVVFRKTRPFVIDI